MKNTLDGTLSTFMRDHVHLGLYKILFHFEVLLHDNNILCKDPF